ncbi:MAG: DotU family type IV/VI secretion system protein [Desulfarculus sp.]|nr:DotU family type IV/VI secretion system protein [Desulfarculus sp.]
MTLLDLTRELFTYLVVFRQRAVSAAPPSLETVNEELEAIFQALEEQAREHPLLGGPYQQVRYGLTVLCDEVLLTSAWPQAVDWALEPLEQRLYGSRQGGTRFFLLLEVQEGAPRDVLAIYYLCLGLGFCGCYAPDDPRLEQIKAGLLARLRAPLKPPPEPMPPPPRRPAFREQAPAPPAAPSPAPETAPPAPEPFPEPPLEPEPQPLPMTAPGPPPEYPAVMPVPEPPPAPPSSRSPALPETPARPRGRPAPPLRRARADWRAAALALGAAGLAGVLLWVALGPWRDGPPSAQVRLGERAAATSPVTEEPKEPTPRPAVVEMAKATQPATPPPEQTVKVAEPTPPPAMDMSTAPPPEPPLPMPEPAKAAEAPPPPPAIETAKAPGTGLPPAAVVAKPSETAPQPSVVEMAKAPESAPSPAVVDAPRPPEPAPPPSPAPQAEPGVYILHAGLYVGPIQSGRLAQRLKGAGLPAFVRQEARGEGKVRYLVLVGPYQQEAQAQEAVENIQRRFGIKPFFMEPPAPPAAPLREPSGSNGSR